MLLPFVAVFGLATSAARSRSRSGALNVGLCWRMLLRVTDRRDAAFLGAIFYGFGTVAWYAAQLGSTWFLAHVVASTFLFLGITAALDGDRRERLGARRRRAVGGWVRAAPAVGRPALRHGRAGAPDHDLRGALLRVRGRRRLFWRRAVSAGIGAVIPVLVLLGYNVATTGHVFHPAYELPLPQRVPPGGRVLERPLGHRGPALHPAERGHHAAVAPADARSSTTPPARTEPNQEGLDILFDKDCPLIRPDKLGMSILLTSPAYLLAIPALFALLAAADGGGCGARDPGHRARRT